MLAAKQLSVELAGRPVLRGIDLAIAPGVLTVIAGPNGAGKSTLLKALTGLLRPTSGRATLDATPLAAWPPRALAERRAVLAQSQTIGFPFTVHELVALGARAGGSLAGVAGRVARSLEAVGLEGKGDRLVQQLSGGEQQRVHIARVLCQLGGATTASGAARWLFLDEPTAGLDIAHQIAVLDLARAHAREGGGVVAVLHDLNLASLYGDRLLLFAEGFLAADGPPREVLSAETLKPIFGSRLTLIDHDGRRYVLPTARVPETM